ncbi:DASH complex subunit Dad3-domain-containing protein [Lipomyces japonicus]|uniref:DASH complex subunit Dad3-domain-containing protein n=1 Tax=Lipomyces japonicus TaxID=56871 RepID=UPI0034CFFB99
MSTNNQNFLNTPLSVSSSSSSSTAAAAPAAEAVASSDVMLQLLSPVEQDLLHEYKSLSQNLLKLSTEIAKLAEIPTPEILDNLRILERKTALVFTLLKASVYSIFLQQQLHEQDGDVVIES